LPLLHWESWVQAPGQLTEEPSQTYAPHAGLPAESGVHVPTLPATLHASHALPQAVLQHTPSTQLPLPHWLLAVHAPAGVFFGTQAPASQ